jgi:type IV secretory pathway VirB3-like protein
MKDSSVGIKGKRVLECLTLVIIFVFVISVAMAVPIASLLHVIYSMICAAALNKISVLLLASVCPECEKLRSVFHTSNTFRIPFPK